MGLRTGKLLDNLFITGGVANLEAPIKLIATTDYETSEGY